MAYVGYDPERTKVERSRQIAELLQQRALDTGPKSLGSGIAQIGQALLARHALGKADKAETTYADSRKRIADALIGQSFPDSSGILKADLASDKPVNLTPEGNAERQARGGLGDQVRTMAQLTNDPLQAIQYGQSQQALARQIALQDEQARRERNKPIIANAGDRGFTDANGDGVFDEVFNVPGAPGSQPGSRVQSTYINKDGRTVAVMGDATEKVLGEAQNPFQIGDVGGVPTAINRRTGEGRPVSTIDEVAYNTAAGKSAEKQGTLQGEAAFNLPQVESRGQMGISSIRDLASRDLGSRFGLQSKVWAIPGTEGANVQALLKQVQSQAFLNAFDQLRGAGAITEMEGKAATAAVTRLSDQSISVGEALKAMEELTAYYQKGIEIARKKAVAAPVLPQRGGPQPNESDDDLLARYGVR